MVTKPEAEQLAKAVNALRPDWSQASLMAVLADERCRNRPKVDISIAFVVLALDDATRKPTRIFEHGPWWEILRPLGKAAPLPRYAEADDCAICNKPRQTPHDDHTYQPRLPPEEWARPTTEQRELMRLATEKAHIDATAVEVIAEHTSTPEERETT